MPTWDDVRRLALALPETAERASYGGRPSWTVRDTALVWARPLRANDAAELGARAPDGPVSGALVADEGVKQALLAGQPQVYFTTSHFDGYASVLIRLGVISTQELTEIITEAWPAPAPKRLAAAYERA